MKRLHLLLIVVLSLLLASFAIWGAFWIYGSKTTLPKGTHAGGLPLGGLSKQEALHLLQAYKSAMDGRIVTLKDGEGAAFSRVDKPQEAEAGWPASASWGGDWAGSALAGSAQATDSDVRALAGSAQATEAGHSASWRLRELGVTLELEAAEAAVSRLATGSAWSRAKYRWHWSPQLPTALKLQRAKFDAALRSEWGFYDNRKPVDAIRSITADDLVIYTPGRSALHLDLEQQLAQIRQWAETPAGSAPLTRSSQPEASGLKALQGYALLQALGIETRLSGRVQLKAVQPSKTVASLRAEGIDRLIASFTTDYSSSSQGRAFNVSETARTLSGWEMKPGEVFHYDEIITKTERETGYREAPVILNGQLTPGIGGGICQVSSTLYNAVLLAGLDIVERSHHSVPVSYLPLGRDATFADGLINFRFRNSSGKHLLIMASSGQGKLTVKLFGTLAANVTYGIITQTVDVLEPPVQTKPTALLPPGESRLLAKGRTGYIIDTFRITYIDGVESSRKRISHDIYKAQPELIEVGQANPDDGSGTTPSSGGVEPRQQPLLEDGIRLLPGSFSLQPFQSLLEPGVPGA